MDWHHEVMADLAAWHGGIVYDVRIHLHRCVTSIKKVDGAGVAVKM